jgi:hypothetical protein
MLPVATADRLSPATARFPEVQIGIIRRGLTCSAA